MLEVNKEYTETPFRILTVHQITKQALLSPRGLCTNTERTYGHGQREVQVT